MKRIIQHTRNAVYHFFHFSFLSSNSSWGAKYNEPLVIIRLKTCIKTAIAALLTFMFVVLDPLRVVVHPVLYAIMQSIFVTLIVHQSITGVARNSYDLLQGGLVGCIAAYLIRLISPNVYVSLAFFFIANFCIGAYDPMLLNPLFMRVSIWDMLVIVFFPVDPDGIIDVLLMYVMHMTTVLCAFIPFLLLWPNLSSRQFPKEFRVCCNDCLDLFKCISSYMTDLTHTITDDPIPRTPSFGKSVSKNLFENENNNESNNEINNNDINLNNIESNNRSNNESDNDISPYPSSISTISPLTGGTNFVLSPISPNSNNSNSNNDKRNSLSKSPSDTNSENSFTKYTNSKNMINHKILLSDSESSNNSYSIQMGTALSSELLEERILQDKNLQRHEKDFRRNLRRLSRVSKEAAWEPWNKEKLQEYDTMIIKLELCLHKLTALKQACSRGFFSSSIGLNFVLPMVPIFEELQAYIVKTLTMLTSSARLPPEDNSLEILLNKMEDQYMECANFFEATGSTANTTSSLTRMVFLFFGTSELAKDIATMEKSVRNLKRPTHSNSAVEFLLNYFKDFSLIEYVSSSVKIWVGHFLSLFNFRVNFMSYMRSYAWVFPLQLTIGCTLTAYLMHEFKLDILPTQHWTGIWSCITFKIVILPSLGATLKRSFHRIIGTLVGAYVGYACIIVARDIQGGLRDFVLSIFLIIFIGVSSYMQQVPRYAYTGLVTAFTFLLVLDGQYFVENPDVYYPTMRSIHIIFGLVLVVLVSGLIFPRKSYVKFQQLLHSTTIEIAGLCGLAAEEAFKKEPPSAELAKKIMQLRAKLQTLRVLLKQAKPELIFHRDSFMTFKKSSDQLLLVYYALISIHSAACSGFQDDTIETLLGPLRKSIFAVVTAVQNSSKTMLHENDDASIMREAVVQLDEEFFELRSTLMQERHYFKAHPDLRNVSKLIYTMRDFAKKWIELTHFVGACMRRERYSNIQI